MRMRGSCRRTCVASFSRFVSHRMVHGCASRMQGRGSSMCSRGAHTPLNPHDHGVSHPGFLPMRFCQLSLFTHGVVSMMHSFLRVRELVSMLVSSCNADSCVLCRSMWSIDPTSESCDAQSRGTDMATALKWSCVVALCHWRFFRQLCLSHQSADSFTTLMTSDLSSGTQ